MTLADDGIWVFEQSYMPSMLSTNSYDTVCHEHLEFYALRQIKWMTDRAGFKIIDVELNDVNGGSFSADGDEGELDVRVTSPGVQRILDQEVAAKRGQPQAVFGVRRSALRPPVTTSSSSCVARTLKWKSVAAVGASTKGNVLLQYCGFSEKDISAVGEVNSDKFGCFTPGSWLPIISEKALLDSNPDYLIVLPWHFRRFFERAKAFQGINLVFPLPELSISFTLKQNAPTS